MAGRRHRHQRDDLVHAVQLAGLARALVRVGRLRRRHHLEHRPTRSTSPTASTVSPRAPALLAFLAFTIIAYWAFRNPEIYGVGNGGVVNPLDLAVLAAAFAGACGGFLWFNAAPARIIMGDVGALAIGTALALLALTTNTQILLVLICGINVMEAGSVAVQMVVFKASGRKRRLFRMSPIHHHFELLGWPETTVIIRFWLIAGICVATSLAIFIGDFTRLWSCGR